MADLESAANTPKRKNLTTPEKKSMVAELLKGSINGHLVQGDFKRVAAMYQQHPRTVSKCWRMYLSKKEAGEVEVMLARGDNTFKLPHLRKATAARRGTPIPTELPCSREAWEAALNYQYAAKDISDNCCFPCLFSPTLQPV